MELSSDEERHDDAAPADLSALARGLAGKGGFEDAFADPFADTADSKDAFPSTSDSFKGLREAAGDDSSDDGAGGKGGKKKKKKGGGFQTFGLSREVMRGVMKMGYTVPTPIQRKAIPVLLQGNDAVAMARTGSGKTAAYMVPLLNRLGSHSHTVGVRGLVLAPTRELAIQILRVAKQLGKYTDLRYCVLVGGFALSEQFTDLAGNPDVLIATPGRLLHILHETEMKLKLVECVVLDEADRLFEMGMAPQISEILKKLPEGRQSSLFSATLPAALAEFASAGLSSPQLIRLDADVKISDKLELAYFVVRREEKAAALLFILRELIGLPDKKSQTIVFTPTRHHAEYLVHVLERVDIPHSMVHGNMDQEMRKSELQSFSARKTSVLLVTDVAARGIDIPLLDNVVNFECPDRPKLFVHRVGRVARAGRSGRAYSLVTHDELPHVLDTHLFLGRALETEAKEGTEEASLWNGYLGTLPAHLLEGFQSSVQAAIESSPEAGSAEKGSRNAFRLYFRSRRPASAESQRKGRTMQADGVPTHPLLLLDRYTGDREKARSDVVKQLREYRPSATIFDVMKQQPKELMKKILTPAAGGVSMEHERKRFGGKRSKVQKAVAAAAAAAAAASGGKKKSLRSQLLSRVGTQQNLGRALEQKEKKKQDVGEFFLPYQQDTRHEDKGYSINDIKGAVLDVAADTSEGITRQRQVYAWRAKTNRYVKVNLAEAKTMASKVRNESGKRIDFRNEKQGKLLERWTKQSNIRLQQVGEEENPVIAGERKRGRSSSRMTTISDEALQADGDDAEAAPAKRQRLGHRGKKKAAEREANVKSFDEARRELRGGKGGKGGRRKGAGTGKGRGRGGKGGGKGRRKK